MTPLVTDERDRPMRIGVFGAGAIGCYVGGKLAAAGCDVVMVGRLGRELARSGLQLSDLAGGAVALPAERVVYRDDPAALADRDLVLVTVKSIDSEAAGRTLAAVLGPGAIVVSLQNGVSNPELLRAQLGGRAVVAGMVPFNVVRTPTGGFHQATSGPLGIERFADPGLVGALRRAGFEVVVHDDLRGLQWSKLLLNLNNSVNALAGLPLRQQLGVRAFRRVFGRAFAEGLRCLRAAGIRPVRVGRMVPALGPVVLTLPDLLFFRAASAMVKIDPQARSSMLEDLERGRATEIDFLNGEIVRLGLVYRVPVPVNTRIVELVHAAEQAGRGSPRLPADELLRLLGME
jgi:2-dehydropantoate 2-reductase